MIMEKIKNLLNAYRGDENTLYEIRESINVFSNHVHGLFVENNTILVSKYQHKQITEEVYDDTKIHMLAMIGTSCNKLNEFCSKKSIDKIYEGNLDNYDELTEFAIQVTKEMLNYSSEQEVIIENAKKDLLDMNEEYKNLQTGKESNGFIISQIPTLENYIKDALYSEHISQEETNYYIKNFANENGVIEINLFQINLALFLTIKGKGIEIANINKYDAVKLIIIAKKKLKKYGLVILPYIIGGKFIELHDSENIFKNNKIKGSLHIVYEDLFLKALRKGDTATREYVEKQLSTLLLSKYSIIDFEDKSLTGEVMNAPKEILMQEYRNYFDII